MKRTLALLLSLTLVAAMAAAQGQAAAPKAAPAATPAVAPAPGRGLDFSRIGLNFGFDGLGSFGISGVPAGVAPQSYLSAAGTPTSSDASYYGVGLRYSLDKSTDLRSGLSLGFQSTKDNASTTRSSFSLVLRPALLSTLASTGDLRLYWGPYAELGFTSASLEPSGGTATTLGGFGIGGGALIGAETSLLGRLSLGAEYSLGLAYRSSTYAPAGGTSTYLHEFSLSTGSFGTYLGFKL